MALPPRTNALVDRGIPTGTLTTLATVPPGERWLAKFFAISNTTGSARFVAVSKSGPLGGSVLFWEVGMPNNTVRLGQELYWVLDAGDNIYGYTDGATGANVGIHLGGLVFLL